MLSLEESNPLADWSERRKRRKKKEGDIILQARGGLILDFSKHPGVADEFAESYFGFNFLSLGIARMKAQRMNGLEVDLFSYNRDADLVFNPDDPFNFPLDWNRERRGASLSAYSLFALSDSEKFRLYTGPFLSFMIVEDFSMPTTAQRFPVVDNTVGMGLGLKLEAYYQLNDKIYINIGLRTTLLDAGRNRSGIKNPLLTTKQQTDDTFKAKFLRGDFYVPIGLMFVL